MNKIVLLVILLTVLNASEIKGAKSLAVTVYNDQFAIVKDVRSISFDQGRSDLYFTDVSSNIETQTVSFKAINNPQTIKVFQQNYQANLVTSQALLKKYINKNVQIFIRQGTTSSRINGTLLGYQNGFILKTNKGIQMYENIQGATIPELPQGFFTMPTLNWKVFSQNKVTTDCEVAYRTTGFKWKADYSVIMSSDQKKADIGGWVTIDNYSGKRYQDAKLKLIAGDVNLVNSNTIQPKAFAAMRSESMVADAAPSFSQKSFSDFHMYTLSQTVSLQQNSQKQIQFIPKVYGTNIRKYNYISVNSGGYSQKKLKASNKIQISNTKANQMGMPLPKGTVRVFKEDTADGSLQFLGQDSIDHTPQDQNFTLTTGNAFDITADKIATNRRSFENGGFQADLNMTIRNHKNIAAEIVVQISNYYGDNNRFTWTTFGLNAQKVSASTWRITRTFAANQKMSYLWQQNYRR